MTSDELILHLVDIGWDASAEFRDIYSVDTNVSGQIVFSVRFRDDWIIIRGYHESDSAMGIAKIPLRESSKEKFDSVVSALGSYLTEASFYSVDPNRRLCSRTD